MILSIALVLFYIYLFVFVLSMIMNLIIRHRFCTDKLLFNIIASEIECDNKLTNDLKRVYHSNLQVIFTSLIPIQNILFVIMGSLILILEWRMRKQINELNKL